MLSAIRLPPAPLVKAASRGAAACITTPVPRAAAAALSTAAAGFVACKAPKRAQVAPPTLPEPALDAFLSPSGAVPVPSFGALLFPAFGGVRSRIERNYERSSLLIWPRRSHSTSASGPPSEIDAKAPAATVNPSAEDDRALIDRLPELLRKPFEAKWEAPALRKHLLEKLSTAQLFLSQKNAISVVQTELSAFASVVPEAISDVVATRKKDVEKIHSAGDPRTFAQTFYGWVEQWSKNHAMLKNTPELIQASLAGLIQLTPKKRNTDNFDYPLVDLQVATTAIKAHMINRLERPGKSTDRLRFPSLLASTLPGAGKSRLCQEFVGSIAPDVFNSRRLEFISLFVTFNNATNFDSIKDWTIVHNADPEHALATRLLQAYFDIPPTFFELNFAQTGSFQVAATLKFIQQFEFKRRRGRAPKPGDQLPYVAIAVDEINRLLAVSADALKEPAAVKRADAASNADEQDKVGAQEKLVSEANPVPQVLSASEASVVQANLARQRYLEKVKSQRWLLKQTLWSLKAATIDPASRLFVLYAGTLPEHLRPGLVEPLDSNASGSSNLAVNPVPMEPFDGPHTAEFVDVVAGVKQTKLDWRLDATLVGQLRIAGGLPRHIEDVMDVDTPDAIARPQLSPISLIKLVRFCAFNARLTGKPLLEDVAAWVSRGAAVAAQSKIAARSLQFNLYKPLALLPADQVLEPVRHSLELIEQLAGSLKQCLNSITADMQGSASRPDLWERLVVHLFNLRVTAYLADHVLSSLAPSSSIRVPLTELLPGVKFGPGCSELSLKLNPKTLKNFSFMQLADRGEPGIDAYMHADLVGHRSKTRVVIGLQMKLHMQLKSMTPTKYEKAARKQLEKHYVDEQHRQNTLVLVGIMSTSRRATTDPPKHSWVLERDTLDEFAQGFQKVVQCAYSFDPHHSPATHIASFLYSWGTKSQAVCDALAHLLVQTRHRVHQPDSRQQFRTAEDLRQFLLAQIGASKEVSFTLTESGKTKQVAHTLTKKDVPLVKHLGWYFALPRKARSATSSSSASVSS